MTTINPQQCVLPITVVNSILQELIEIRQLTQDTIIQDKISRILTMLGVKDDGTWPTFDEILEANADVLQRLKNI